MSTVQAPPQQKVQKYLVQNNTAGYVGVVKINPRTGEEEGDNIEPHGTTWLTHDEIVATSRAPRRAEDNPFAEQTFIGVDPETQQRVEFKQRPLTLASDTRELPENDRYVPTQVGPEGASPAAAQEVAKAVAPIPAPASGQAASAAPPLPPAPTPVAPSVGPVSRGSSAGLSGVPAAPSDEPQSWTEPPEAPGRVLDGSLQGSDDPGDAIEAPEPTNHPATESGERFVPSVHSARSAPQTVGSQPEEEHAAAVDPAIGEETGAARPPAQPQPEGEYAASEEVGSPDAPRSHDETQNGG